MKKDKCVNLSVRTSAKRGLCGLEILGKVSWIDGFMDEMQFELDLRTFWIGRNVDRVSWKGVLGGKNCSSKGIEAGMMWHVSRTLQESHCKGEISRIWQPGLFLPSSFHMTAKILASASGESGRSYIHWFCLYYVSTDVCFLFLFLQKLQRSLRASFCEKDMYLTCYV